MTAPRAPTSWWPIAAAGVIATAAALSLAGTFWVDWRGGQAASPSADELAILLGFQAYLVVGVVLVARRPDNPLSWLLAGVGLLTNLGGFAEGYARLSYAVIDRPLPGALAAAWFTGWWWFPAITTVLLFVPLLFPTGRPPSPRWRWLLRFVVADLAVVTVLAALAPELTGQDAYRVRNPIGVAAVGNVEETAVGVVLLGALLPCMAAAIASLVVRYRRAPGDERRQLKWFVYAGTLAVGLPLVQELGLDRVLHDSDAVFGLVIALPPLAIGVAVLRYRLYDIDRIVSRTVAYALVSGLLVAVYAAAVVVLNALLPLGDDSPVTVAAATLAAAAAFNPLRRRVQAAVDRRFNRARYDAARTVEAFGTRLRDATDLDDLAGELREAVTATVQPQRSSLWLRPTETR